MNQSLESFGGCGASFAVFARPIRARFPAGLALILAVAVTPLARAQTVTLTPTQTNLFAGAAFSGVYSSLQLRAVLTDVVAPVLLTASSPPTGVTVDFSTNNITNTMTVTLTVAVTNVARGIYPLTISASGGASASTRYNFVVGELWIASEPANTNWSVSTNWSASAVPVPGADVMFQDSGVTTNFVDASLALNSLTYIRTISGASHSTTIAPGATLSVTGSGGFAASVDALVGNNKTTTVNLSGTNGASLVVSNQTANFTVNAQNSGASGTTLNLSGLDNFSAVVNRFGLGDVTLAEQGAVGNQLVVVSLARTNLIRAGFSGDYNGTQMTNAISFISNGDVGNNGSANTINLGISNAFFADSMRFFVSRVGAANNTVRFLPAFVANVPSVYFRNTNGGRIAFFGIAVDAGTSNSGNNSRGTLDLRGGAVDLLADTMWIGRFRTTSLTAGASARGILTMERGNIDVNTLVLGFQAYTNEAFCQGTLNVLGAGTFAVNNTLTLGYTAGSTNTANAAQSFGQITISSNGTVRANRIIVDGGTGGLSANNNITINTGGQLIVSNTVAGQDKMLSTLALGGNSTLILHLDGTHTGPYVYVTNLTTASSNNYIRIGSLTNLTFPVQVPLIFYAAGGPSLSGVLLPPGYTGSLINNGAGSTYDVSISTNAPKTLVWRGTTADWDATTKNWMDVNAGVLTNFSDGDTVTFDDTPGFPTSINLAGSQLIPGGITVSNSALNYSFSGSGSILGSAILTKTGTGSLTIDGSSTASVVLNQGSLSGGASGSVGSLTVASTASVNFSGRIAGGLTCAGRATTSGLITGNLAVQSGGTVTNQGALNGSFSTQSGALLVNSGALTNFGACAVGPNATLINSGVINGDSITVNGTYRDTGLGTVTLTILTIANGGTFLPGGNGIGTTAINSTGIGNFPGRVVFASGSTNFFKVDLANPQTNTVVLSGFQDFGPSQSNPATNGGTILITNVGTITFSAGQSFKLFGNVFNGGDILPTGAATNSFPILQPPTPGIGLAWDLTRLRPEGRIGIIVGIPTTPTNITFSVAGTNLTLSWPANYTGWQLQQQTNNQALGVSTNPADWGAVAGSATTNQVIVPVNSTQPGGYFRLVLP